MKRNVRTISLTMAATVVVSTLLIGPALTNNSWLALAASDASSECKNAADKISSKAEAHQSEKFTLHSRYIMEISFFCYQ
jgi:hypothetical protein